MRGIIRVLFVLLILQSCKKHLHRSKSEFSHLEMRDSGQSLRFNDSIGKYKNLINDEMQKILVVSSGAFTKDGDETTLGNLVCDAMERASVDRYQLKPDVVLVNRGGLRTELPEGKIKRSHIFELMPFDNDVVALNISGDQLLEIIKLIRDKRHAFKGMQLGFKEKIFLCGGQPIDGKKEYLLVTSSYLAEGGDNFTMFGEQRYKNKSTIKLRDAIIDYCIKINNEKSVLRPYKDGRFNE